MTENLSDEEAEEIVKTILSDIRRAIDTSSKGKARIYMRDIANISPVVKREGITSDVYYKISCAMFNQGIGTDIGISVKGDAVLSFRNVIQGETVPTLAFCKVEWNDVGLK